MSNQQLTDQICRLNCIGMTLAGEAETERLFDLIVSELRSFANAEAGGLFIRNNGHLECVAKKNGASGRGNANVHKASEPSIIPVAEDTVTGLVALTRQSLNIRDMYTYENDTGHIPDFNWSKDLVYEYDQDNRPCSLLLVPLLDESGETLGVLQLVNARDPLGNVVAFSKETEDLVSSLASQAAISIEKTRLLSSVKNLFTALVQYSASALDARSPHTAGHSRRVAMLAHSLAKAVNRQTEGPWADFQFSPYEIEELTYAAWLHDVGKIGVSERILEKSQKLDTFRMKLIQSRFDRIKMSIHMEYIQKKVELLLSSQYDDDSELELLTKKEVVLKNIDEDLAFIRRINNPIGINNDDLERLQAIAHKEFVDVDERRRRFLDDDELLNLSVRQGNLTPEEYEEIQAHVQHFHKIVALIPFTPELARIPEIAGSHHERLNGTGYPKGLKGNEIPTQARILAVADIFDALVAADRPYKGPMTIEEARDILLKESEAGHLDGNVVELLFSSGVAWEIEQITRHKSRGS